MIGLIVIGWLSDHNLRITIILSSVGSALAVFLLWGLSPSLPSYAAFSFTFGFLALGWAAQYPRFASACAADDPKHASMLLSIFLAGKLRSAAVLGSDSESLNRSRHRKRAFFANLYCFNAFVGADW